MSAKIKKIIPYCLMFIILVGLFSPMAQVRAQAVPDPDEKVFCVKGYGFWEKLEILEVKRSTCTTEGGQEFTTREAAEAAIAADKAAKEAKKATTPFEQEITDLACGYHPTTWFNGCLLKVLYNFFFQLPSFILWLSAQFFDIMIDLGIKSSVIEASGFIPEAWAVVRDISNIFFILVLLYIAIKTILGLGGHEVKQMIAKVVIMALLINFSMFFTKIVIDSSNILALIFYNKLDVKVTSKDGIERPVDGAYNGGKDISGAMWKTFDATRLIDDKTIGLLKKNLVDGKMVDSGNLSFALTLGIIAVAGAIMLWAAYAFFIAGVMFIGRLIELWLLIIFSPFAFMSFTIPKFASIDYLGWDAWFKRLISTAFMAPIFMFFIYLIFMLLPHIYKPGGGGVQPMFDRTSSTILGAILTILIPALIIIAMLLKATEFAKKGGGQFGSVVSAVAGLAIGGAALGVAAIGRGTLGSFMKGASTGDSVNQRFARGEIKRSNYATGKMGSLSYGYNKAKGALAHYGTGTIVTRAQEGLGKHINKNQEKVEGYTHARIEFDKESQARYHKDYKNLTSEERNVIKERINRNNESQELFGKAYKDLNATEKLTIDSLTKTASLFAGFSALTPAQQQDKRKELAQDNLSRAKFQGKTYTSLSAAEKDEIDSALAPRLSVGPEHYVQHLADEARGKQGIYSTLLQASRTGSYDIRGIANATAKEYNSLGAKITTGLMSGIASGMRGTLKSVDINYGTPQKAFFKDLGNTISEALKGVKINVDLSHVGEIKKEDSHGGGGHGGGGHH